MAFLRLTSATLGLLCLSVVDFCQAQGVNVGPPLGSPAACDRCPLDSYCDVSAVRSGGEAVCRRCTVCNSYSTEVSRCSRLADRVCRCSFPLGDRCGRTTVRSAHWIGYLNNAAEIIASTSNSAAATFNTIQNVTDSGSTAIVKSATAGIIFRQPGVVIFSYHQDVLHPFDYLALFSKLNGQTVTQELNKATNQKWDGIATGGSVRVASGDNLAFYFDMSRARPATSVRIDNGKWGVASALWISESAGAQTLKLLTANGPALVQMGGRVKYSRGYSVRETAFQPQLASGDVRFAKDGIVRFVFHQDIKHRCHNVKLRASLRSASHQYFTLPGTQRVKMLVKEEQKSSNNAWDGLSVSGSTPVREGDSFALDLDALDGCVAGIDNGAWGVLSMLYLPNDVAWSSGPVRTETGHIEGTALGSVRFAANPGTSGDPVQIEDDVVQFRYYGNAVYDLHLSVDNQCSHYAYVEAHVNQVVVGRELIFGPTGNFVDGISLSGSVTAQPGDELVFILSCNSGHFRKIRNGSFSLLFISKRP